MTQRDFTLTMNDDGTPLAHRPDCPMVEQHRQQGRPLLTLFDCANPITDDIKQHSCLKPAK